MTVNGAEHVGAVFTACTRTEVITDSGGGRPRSKLLDGRTPAERERLDPG